MVKEDSWGKKKLAYPINKNSVGIYQFLLVELIQRAQRMSKDLSVSQRSYSYLIVSEEVPSKSVGHRLQEETKRS